MFRTRLAASAAAAMLVATLAACGGSADETAATNADGTTKISMTSLSLCNELSLYALDKGIFTKNGLDVEVVSVKSGSAGIAALQGGSVNVAFVSPQALYTAIQEGIDLQIISDSGETTADSQGIIVGKDSKVTGAKDLEGKTVAVNDLGGTIVSLTKEWISDAGGDPSKTKFVALGFADIQPAVAGGKVDAGAVTAADVQKMTAAGGKTIGNPTFEKVGATPNALYAVSGKWLKANQKSAESFVTAMQEAADAAKADTAGTEKFGILSKYCKTPAATLADIPEIDYSGYINMTALDNSVKVLKDFEVLKPEFDVLKNVPEFARAK
ncbi:ABC transporter substrate-binding protein [Cryptosporangium sp. NPDC048952]|uniref:ABC transporter substrate-binding protein n=1 Tax=Cryptosporangium sp. NPDC048952 TaxID=3363961 RepID=UPI003715B427